MSYVGLLMMQHGLWGSGLLTLISLLDYVMSTGSFLWHVQRHSKYLQAVVCVRYEGYVGYGEGAPAKRVNTFVRPCSITRSTYTFSHDTLFVRSRESAPVSFVPSRFPARHLLAATLRSAPPPFLVWP